MTLEIQKCPFTHNVEDGRFGIEITTEGLSIYFQIECNSDNLEEEDDDEQEDEDEDEDQWTSKRTWIDNGAPAVSTKSFKLSKKLNLAKFPFQLKVDSEAVGYFGLHLNNRHCIVWTVFNPRFPIQ